MFNNLTLTQYHTLFLHAEAEGWYNWRKISDSAEQRARFVTLPSDIHCVFHRIDTWQTVRKQEQIHGFPSNEQFLTLAILTCNLLLKPVNFCMFHTASCCDCRTGFRVRHWLCACWPARIFFRSSGQFVPQKFILCHSTELTCIHFATMLQCCCRVVW